MNIQSSFTVYTAALHALILILFSLHTSGLGYPGLTWIYCISTNKSFSSPKTSSRKPYSNSKQQEKQKHSAETTLNFSDTNVFISVDSLTTNKMEIEIKDSVVLLCLSARV